MENVTLASVVKRGFLLVAVSVGGFLFSSPSHAQLLESLLPENKIVTGAACVPGGGNKWDDFIIRASSIQNVSTVPRYAACTIPLDSEAQWDSYSVPLLVTGHANVHVQLSFENSPGGTVTCTAQITHDGVITETGSASAVGFSGSTRVDLVIPDMDSGNGTDSPLGLSCLLPPMVRLNAIRLEEVAITDVNLVPIL
ncbi:hypothetical protein [Marilutibacter chinensis]|uniref:Secreted protein n=1 Tax=Marilutibacter chinensis TaxID=2912247 RepID=A0ABS9HSH8_9GAMM|nr:hypothetical protein [Lysobacter chinensis]MCF7221310.1 hypothetical protein [Lysobacter chinensis]